MLLSVREADCGTDLSMEPPDLLAEVDLQPVEAFGEGRLPFSNALNLGPEA